MLRRLVFVFGIAPMIAYGFVRWIITGKDFAQLIEDFQTWALES